MNKNIITTKEPKKRNCAMKQVYYFVCFPWFLLRLSKSNIVLCFGADCHVTLQAFIPHYYDV